MISSYVLLVIVVGAFVTWLPRVLPFVLVKYQKLPHLVTRFLKYLPVSIIFALTFSSFFTTVPGRFPVPNVLEILVSFPVIWVAFRYRNLLLTVGVGVCAMALLRLIF